MGLLTLKAAGPTLGCQQAARILGANRGVALGASVETSGAAPLKRRALHLCAVDAVVLQCARVPITASARTISAKISITRDWNGLRAFKLMRYASRVPKYCGVD
jgi:hypothetical protein